MISMGTGSVRMTVQSRGQVTLPKKMRMEMSLEPGDTVIAVPDGDGVYRLERFKPMSINEMYERWGNHEPSSFEEVEEMIRQAEEDYATELAREYEK